MVEADTWRLTCGGCVRRVVVVAEAKWVVVVVVVADSKWVVVAIVAEEGRSMNLGGGGR